MTIVFRGLVGRAVQFTVYAMAGDDNEVRHG